MRTYGPLLLTLLSLGSAAQAACDREQAFNRMMALNQFGMKLQAELPDPLEDPAGYRANYERVQAFGTELSSGGQLLASGRYDEACALYDRLSRAYAVDEAAQAVQPLSAYEQPATPTTGCDLAEAALRAAWLNEAFQKHAAERSLDRQAWVKFGNETEPLGLAMQQDPQRACELIDEVAGRYGLKR